MQAYPHNPLAPQAPLSKQLGLQCIMGHVTGHLLGGVYGLCSVP